jgi:hypothetical protein
MLDAHYLDAGNATWCFHLEEDPLPAEEDSFIPELDTASAARTALP